MSSLSVDVCGLIHACVPRVLAHDEAFGRISWSVTRAIPPLLPARPSNTAVRELIGNGAYAEALLSFPRETDVGEVKARVLDRDAG